MTQKYIGTNASLQAALDAVRNEGWNGEYPPPDKTDEYYIREKRELLAALSKPQENG